MISPARFVRLEWPRFSSSKVERVRVFAPALRGPRHGGKPPCQEGKCARSGRVADAVRERSFGRRIAPLDLAAPLRFILLLTPARLCASNWHRQIGGEQRAGGRFQTEPAWNRCWNRHPLEIAINSRRFQRFQLLASRDACACACAQTRAYMREENLGTLEPTLIHLINQWVSGSIAVPNRFQLGTAALPLIVSRRVPPFSIILAGGNAADLRGDIVQVASSSLLLARGGESFGVFRAGAVGAAGLELLDLVAIGADLQLLGLVGTNGGIPPFPALPIGRVGRQMLEGCAQRRRNAGVAARPRKPRGLPRRALVDGLDRVQERRPARAQGTPRCPHFRTLRAPARSRATVAEFGSAISFTGSYAGQAGGRQTSGRATGRGEGFARGQGANCAAGRGEGRFAGERLRRKIEASGRFGRVN